MPTLSDLGLALLGAFLAFAVLTWLFPALLRGLWRPVLHVVYRFRVYNADRMPATGPAIVVANHVSYIDWMIFWAATPRRVNYVFWAGYYKNPVLRFFLSWVRHQSISLDNRRTQPHATMDALKAVAAALDRGEVVVYFPEGRLTRNGQMLPFGRGVERILQLVTVTVPVIPACSDGLWGSFFSHKDGPIMNKWPGGFRRKVSVWFGEPLPGKPSAAEVRAAVAEAMADVAIRESYELPSVFHAFVRTATRWRNVFRTGFVAVVGGNERRLTFGQGLVATWCLSGWLKKRLLASGGRKPPDSPRASDQNQGAYAPRSPSLEPVGLWLPTGLGSTLANLALGYLGRTTVNLNYTAGREAVESATRQAGLKVVVTARQFVERIPLDLPPDVERIYLEDALGGISKAAKLVRFLAILILPAWVISRLIGLPRTATDDVQTIIFSSGSTGEPKGIMLTRRNIAGNVDGFLRGVPISDKDTMLATLPFFHSFGYTVCLWACVYVGAKAVYYPDPRAAKEVGELCRKHSCTIMMGTATFLRFYLRRSDPADFRSLTLLICGAEKLPVKLAHEFRAKFGVLPLEGYGCTETSPVVCTNLHDVDVGGLKQTANTFGTVGQPIPGVVAKAFHPETHAPLPPGEEGVLCVKGPNVMLGYWDQPEKTAAAMIGGAWYVTGDIGRIEPDGFIRITGRLSRFAKIAGEMVPLERLEHEMQELFGTGERLVTVCAVPDEKRGERLVVLYLPEAADRLDEVLEALPKQGLPNLWVPDRRNCREVEAFPALGSGKLDLKAVDELARKLAG